MRARSERNRLQAAIRDGDFHRDWLAGVAANLDQVKEAGDNFRSRPLFSREVGVPSTTRLTNSFLECCMFGGVDLDEIDMLSGAIVFSATFAPMLVLIAGPDRDVEPGLYLNAAVIVFVCCMLIGVGITLTWALPSIVRPKWELVRFCRRGKRVAVYSVLQGGMAGTAREVSYHWNQLIPLLPPLARARDPWQLDILVMDGNVPVDIIRVGLGVRSSGTAAGQWEYIRRYMTDGTENLPKVKKLSWYLTPWQCADRCSFHWERELEPHGSPESLWLWHGLRKFAIGFWLYLIELLRWQPIWSKSTLIMCGETPWIFYTKAVLQTLAGWATVATLAWSTWWLAETYGVVAWVLNGWYGLLEGR